MNYSAIAAGTTVLANCVRSDGSTFPWALRSTGPNGGTLTYIGENPLVYITEGDRYLAFCDLLFDALAATAPVQHRALLRLEDIDPTFDTKHAEDGRGLAEEPERAVWFPDYPLLPRPFKCQQSTATR